MFRNLHEGASIESAIKGLESLRQKEPSLFQDINTAIVYLHVVKDKLDKLRFEDTLNHLRKNDFFRGNNNERRIPRQDQSGH